MANCFTSMCNKLSRTLVIRIVGVLTVVIILGGIVAVILNFIKRDDTIGVSEESASKQGTKCETQDGSLGVCREKRNCQSLHKITHAQCGQGKFCCAGEPFTRPNENCTSSTDPGCKSDKTSESICKMSSALPDPASGCCGLEAESELRITGGSASRIDEYPWTAALEYVRNGVSSVRCGGSLISGRYVVTAAHCVVASEWTLKNVRLGDYNISNPGKDCVNIGTGGYDCTDGELIVPVENIIPHTSYNVPPISHSHDIALIRLDRVVNYTDFIRPICLPSVDFTKTSPTEVKLYVAGWGSDNVNKSTEIKVSVDLPYVPQQVCQTSYAAAEVKIGDGQLCAGGIKRKDSCTGDSGGPLMKKGARVELVGLVSFGSEWCGKEGIPGIYTKVYAYLPWIKNHVLT